MATKAMMLIVNISVGVWVKRNNMYRGDQKDKGDASISHLTPKDIEDVDWKYPRFRWSFSYGRIFLICGHIH